MRVLTIQVVPRAKRDEVEKTGEDEYTVCVKAFPEKGKANKDAIKVLAHHLGLPISKLMLTKGERFQTKTVIVLV